MKTLLKVCLLGIVLALGLGEAIGQYVWTKYTGNPVIQPGQPGSWDDKEIYPCPVLFRDSVYHLWYTGWDGTADFRYTRSGYARSTNGISWTKHTTPVLDVGNSGAWDAYDAEACAVLYDSAQYKMWYSGYASAQAYQQIGYATGVNETTWTKHTNPVLVPGPTGSWDVAAVMWPYVLRSSPGGGFKMWYTGWNGSKQPDGSWINYQIGYATATNETTWTKHPLNPVLSPGPSGSWDDARVFYGAVVYDSAAALYYMFYTGMNRATAVQRIGVATSSDGISWTKYSGNPVLSPGGTGSWEAKWLIGGGAVMVRDTFRLWYTGADANGVTRFGYATSPKLPGQVALVSPGPTVDVAKDSARFVWRKGTPSVTSYWFEYSPNSQFDTSRVDSTLADTTVVVHGLTSGVTYWWRVRAKNAVGWGPFSTAQPFLTTGISEAERPPTVFDLAQNYPNPFNPSTTIKYELPKASEVKLSVYDLLGREVSVLVNEKRDAGVHEVRFDAAGLSSGVYFYRLQTGDFVQSKRLVILK